MGFFSEFLAIAVDYLWGMPLVILLIGGGLYLIVISRFMPLKGFGHAVSLLRGKHNKDSATTGGQGQITHFQALTNALAATVGLGNIGGVAVAITQGGPGAIFWMWVAALVGMNTKFFECSLAIMYRDKDYTGEIQGGPMYVITKALPKSLKWMGVFFAICGLIGTMALFQVNQLGEYLNVHYNIDPLHVGIVSAILVGYVLFGGIKRLANVTSKLVPVMCVFYVLICIIILLLNTEYIGTTFARIFTEAFTGQAVAGGAMGVAFLEVMKIGVKRAAFSNEAGVGTAPMAHSNAKTAEPIREGLVAMVGPFLDTIIVCTMTALVILISFPEQNYTETSGVLLTLAAFEKNLPGFGGHFLGIAILLFGFTTMLGMSNYNQKCWNFLFKGRKGLGRNSFIIFFCGTIIWGSVVALDDVVNLLDSGYALMAFPNMIATLILAPKVKKAFDEYFAKLT